MAKTMTEKEIREKYPNVVARTLLRVTPELLEALRKQGENERADALEKYKGKQVVNRRCANTKKKFLVATQDLHQSTLHPDERKKSRANAKKEVDVEEEVAKVKASKPKAEAKSKAKTTAKKSSKKAA